MTSKRLNMCSSAATAVMGLGLIACAWRGLDAIGYFAAALCIAVVLWMVDAHILAERVDVLLEDVFDAQCRQEALTEALGTTDVSGKMSVLASMVEGPVTLNYEPTAGTFMVIHDGKCVAEAQMAHTALVTALKAQVRKETARGQEVL